MKWLFIQNLKLQKYFYDELNTMKHIDLIVIMLANNNTFVLKGETRWHWTTL